MKADFSEFSYGFALSYEIMTMMGSNIVGVPLFPSLLTEGATGFDVSFEPAGWSVFGGHYSLHPTRLSPLESGGHTRL
jgi:hypothetical protein